MLLNVAFKSGKTFNFHELVNQKKKERKKNSRELKNALLHIYYIFT